MSATPMHDSMLRYCNDYGSFAHTWPFAPKHPISPDAFFEVSPGCFDTLCNEAPKTFAERKVFGIPLVVNRRLSGINFVLNGGAK